MVSYIDLIKPVYLTKDFLEQYKNKKAPFGQLGLIVYLRTYSRFIPELNRREYWWETVLRVVEYSMSLVPKRPRVPFAEEDLRKEAESLFDMIFNMRGFPSGRTLFVGGSKAAELNPSANFNCSFCTVNSLKSFTDAMYLLLLGCGVGYSIEEQYVSQLPKFNTQVELDVHRPIFPLWRESDKSHEDTVIDYNEHGDIFIDVGDSKQGWTDALKYFLEYFTDFDPAKGKSIIINYDYIRPEGTRLKTFGGRASGYKPLKIMFEEIAARIKATDGTIDPTTAMDIMNSIAKAIVVGGVRRSSQIAFGDVSDNKFRDAKKDLWTDPDKEQYRTTRVLSNNSVHLWEKPSYEKLQEIFATIKTNGEPGLSIAQNAAKRRPNYRGSNPCFRGDMRLLTVDGYKTFEELCDTEPLIINAKGQATRSKVWCSGEKEVVQVKLSNRKSIFCTPDHRFLVDDEEVFAKDLKGKRLTPFLQKPIHQNLPVLLGFMQGDGTLTKDQSKLGETVNIGDKDFDVQALFDAEGFTYQTHSKGRILYVNNFASFIDDYGFKRVSTPYRTLPTGYFSSTKQEKAAFLNGLYSANGSVNTSGNRVSFKTTSLDLANELLETLFDDFGIEAYITTNQSKANEFENGTYICRESYDVNIAKYVDKVTFFNEINFAQEYKVEDLATLLSENAPIVTSIKPAGVEKVYDFTERVMHWGVVEGFIAHNCHEILLDHQGVCNLTTLNLAAFVVNGEWDYTNLFSSMRLITRMGSRITLVDMWDSEWDYIQKRDRLLGVSLTGIVEAYNSLSARNQEYFGNTLRELRQTARLEADHYHEQLGIQRSLLVTTVKPEGTISQLPTVSSGVHAPYAPYYKRRIRVSVTDPIAKALRDLDLKPVPENGQGDDLYAPECNTWVFEFPVKTQATIRAIDEPAIAQLERYKMLMSFYAEHTVSVTITVAEHEWDDVCKWVYDNWDYCIGIAFLPRFDPSDLETPYPNMPYEATTEDQYYNLEINEDELIKLISFYETEYEDYDLDASCGVGKGSACPIR